jgi:pimeloyl-ACP methyl ester carboxylesterase
MGEDRLVYHPVSAERTWIDPPPGCIFRDIGLRLPHGTAIHARWYLHPRARSAVLLCHSRSGNLSLELGAAELACWRQQMGCSALIFDYPGFGRSAGRPSEAGCYQAASAAYAWLTEVQQVPAAEVLLYGRSLGSAVAVELACRVPHRALILVSPLTSAPDVACSKLPFLPAHLLMHNRFNSLARISRCPQPIFIVHGTRDRLVPFSQGEALCAAARSPRQMLAVEGAHHGNCLTPDIFPALRRFLTSQEGRADTPGRDAGLPAP